ncbi:MAG: hypothetical protein JXQ29_15505 [Planctomycetes bacterium]|nr:hypothetical protein [Planctomycetota bacterium]
MRKLVVCLLLAGLVLGISATAQHAPGTFLQQFLLSAQVVGLTSVGESLWGVSGTNLYEFDVKTGAVLQTLVHAAAGPYGLSYDQRRREFVMTQASPGTVSRVDMTGKVTTIFPCATTRPIGVAYDLTRDAYWVADWSANVLHLMNAQDGSALQTPFSLSASGCTRSADVGYSPYNDLLAIIGRDKNQAFLYQAGNPPVFVQAVTFGTSISGGARGAHIHPRTQTLWTDSYSTPYALFEFELGLPRVIAADSVPVGKALQIQWVAGNSAGLVYQGAASFTEYVRAIQFGNRYVPLAPDSLLFLSLGLPSVFVNFGGVLDSAGTAAGAVAIPNIPALRGIPFSLGLVTVSPSAPMGIKDISGPWKVAITQ